MEDKRLHIIRSGYEYLACNPLTGNSTYIGKSINTYIYNLHDLGILDRIRTEGMQPVMVYDFDETLYHNDKVTTNPYMDEVLETILQCISYGVYVYVMSYSSPGRLDFIKAALSDWLAKNSEYVDGVDTMTDMIEIHALGPASMVYRHLDEPDVWALTTGRKGVERIDMIRNTNSFIIGNVGDAYRDFEPYVGVTHLVKQDYNSILYNGHIFKIGHTSGINEVSEVRSTMNTLVREYIIGANIGGTRYTQMLCDGVDEYDAYIRGYGKYNYDYELFYSIGMHHTLSRALYLITNDPTVLQVSELEADLFLQDTV